ncbi:DUF6415 family natural product biosynthesis protein [Streptomyces sp. NPDC060064]|uniref:DUF6415 family natural product biosynthesis protein n=1 Tax=Streptomyces sp. NPDC060064 TaxID=3347049 RepID=UPI0036C2D023
MPAERAQPPLEGDALRAVVAKLRAWDPLVVDAIFDDLDRVLGDQTPPADQIDELSECLRGTLMQLVNIAVADPKFPPTEGMLREIARACGLRSEELPGDYWPAVGHLRRLATVTSDLLELMLIAQYIKDSE